MKNIELDELVLLPSMHNVKNEVYELIRISKINEAWYSIIKNFFMLHTNNSFSGYDVEDALYFEKEDAEDLFDLQLDPNKFNELKDLLKQFSDYTISNQVYKKIISEFQESLIEILISKKSTVYIEPIIKYNRSQIFKRKKHRNCKCDIVCVDLDELMFIGIECKLTMIAFYSNLMKKNYNYSNARQLKNIRNAKNKQNYMASLISLFTNKSNAKKVEVYYLTMFYSEDFPKRIGIVPIFSLQNIEYIDIF